MAISYTAAPKAKMSARKSIWSALPSTCSGAPLLQVAKVAGRHGAKWLIPCPRDQEILTSNRCESGCPMGNDVVVINGSFIGIYS